MLNRFTPKTTEKIISDEFIIIPNKGFNTKRRTIVTEETIPFEAYDNKIRTADLVLEKARQDKTDAEAEQALILPVIGGEIK